MQSLWASDVGLPSWQLSYTCAIESGSLVAGTLGILLDCQQEKTYCLWNWSASCFTKFNNPKTTIWWWTKAPNSLYPKILQNISCLPGWNFWVWPAAWWWDLCVPDGAAVGDVVVAATKWPSFHRFFFRRLGLGQNGFCKSPLFLQIVKHQKDTNEAFIGRTTRSDGSVLLQTLLSWQVSRSSMGWSRAQAGWPGWRVPRPQCSSFEFLGSADESCSYIKHHNMCMSHYSTNEYVVWFWGIHLI